MTLIAAYPYWTAIIVLYLVSIVVVAYEIYNAAEEDFEYELMQDEILKAKRHDDKRQTARELVE